MNLMQATYDLATRSVLLDSGVRFPAPPTMSAALERAGEEALTLGVRPEDMRQAESGASSGELLLRGRVILREVLGHETLTHLRLGEQKIITRSAEGVAAKSDGTAAIGVETGKIHFFSRTSGMRIDGESAGALA